MGWSRRAFAASAASATLAVAGCAGASGDDAATEADPEPDRGSPASRFESVQPLQWWATPPDLAVVNASTDGVTAYVTIYGPDWLEAQFRETVSLRGPVIGEPAAGVSFEDVDVVGASGVLAVETADGLRNAHDWDGGSERRGIVVRLHDDRIRFADVHT
jgi:hypothetical protein